MLPISSPGHLTGERHRCLETEEADGGAGGWGGRRKKTGICPGPQWGAQALHHRMQAFRLRVRAKNRKLRVCLRCECSCVCTEAPCAGRGDSKCVLSPGRLHRTSPGLTRQMAPVCTSGGAPDPVCTHARIRSAGLSLQCPVHLHSLGSELHPTPSRVWLL